MDKRLQAFFDEPINTDTTPVSRAFWRVMVIHDNYVKELENTLEHDHVNRDRFKRLIRKSNELMARFDKQLTGVAKREKSFTAISNAPKLKANREIKDSAPDHLNIELERIYDAAIDKSPKGIIADIEELAKNKKTGWNLSANTNVAVFSCACNASQGGKYSKDITISSGNISKVCKPFRDKKSNNSTESNE